MRLSEKQLKEWKEFNKTITPELIKKVEIFFKENTIESILDFNINSNKNPK
jgi:hypothetical protein